MELFREVIRCRNYANEYLKLYEKWFEDLNSMDIMILDYLSENSKVQAKDLSKIFKVDPAYASRRVTFLEKKCYISRVTVGRNKEIILTEKGLKAINEIGKEKDEIYGKLSEDVSTDEIRATIKVLKSMSKIIEV